VRAACSLSAIVLVREQSPSPLAADIVGREKDRKRMREREREREKERERRRDPTDNTASTRGPLKEQDLPRNKRRPSRLLEMQTCPREARVLAMCTHIHIHGVADGDEGGRKRRNDVI